MRLIGAERRMSGGRPGGVRAGIALGFLVLHLAVVPFRGSAVSAGAQEVPALPHVILIVVDALRADRLTAYGNLDSLSPTFDSVAKEGVVVAEAISQAPWTQPSIASLFASCYPGVHGVVDYNRMVASTYFGKPKVAVLGESFTTLAEALSAHGYRTAGFVANPFLVEEYGFAQGFSHWDTRFAKTDASGGELNDALADWLENRPEVQSPLFLYLHYMDVHGPYEARPEILDPLLDKVESLSHKQRLTPKDLEKLNYLRRPPRECSDPERHVRLMRYREYWEARYNACVIEMDRVLNEMQTLLQGAGLWENSLLILTADHGEELFEHKHWDHGHTLHHTELHVPLIMRWKDRLHPGTRFFPRVRLIDLMPTLFELLEIPHWLDLQGESFGRDLLEGKKSEDRDAYSEGVKVGPDQRSLYTGKLKRIQNENPLASALFNRASDPEETQDVSAQDPRSVQKCDDLIATFVGDNLNLSKPHQLEQVELNSEETDRLKSLGYFK
jgi:arylsulfatase A-like enzyme